ncbi:MAG: SRPBCC family protein [Actinobacteria bacterium]|nr:SRPBCC family protein [Actinomycetota bacterium]
MPLVVETIDIGVEPGELFPVISDYERYSDFMENVKEVNIVERCEGYELVEFILNVDGRIIKWIERNYYKPSENRIDFELVKGDLKTMGGYWQLESSGLSTKVEYSIHFEFGIPMLAPLVHPLYARKLRENMKQMLAELKKKVESK